MKIVFYNTSSIRSAGSSLSLIFPKEPMSGTNWQINTRSTNLF